MPLPSSGAISLDQVNVELSRASGSTISLNDAAVRNLFQVASGAISMSNGYGKANEFPFTISASVANVDLRTLALNAGWNGVSKPVCTINSGVYVYSNSTGSPAMTVSGSFPNGVRLVNNGVIIGRGGNGGDGGGGNPGVGPGHYVNGNPGGGGGVALSVSVPISIQNNSIIGGGGGGGGGGGTSSTGNKTVGNGGNGGGGGIGGSGGGAGGLYNGYGGGNPGGAGTISSAGGGGSNGYGGAGGNGGSYGSAGATGGTGAFAYNGAGGSGGGAGACTSGNAYITWLATGSRYGPLN